MGDHLDEGYRSDGEDPIHMVSVGEFSLDATAVTNSAFDAFVAATGHVTDAERFGWSAVFHLAVSAPDESIAGTMAGAPWWLGVNGADWRHPGGPDSDLGGLDVRLAISEHLARELDDRRFEPPAVLRRLVDEGHVGKKSGRGFYDWSSGEPKEPDAP